jgi:hypothetical protein
MPFKHNACRRHHVGKMKFKVTNWSEYEAGLRRRGSLTLWMTPEALSSWPAPKRTTRGGQPRYSDLAIETALTLGLVFGLRLRQTEGFLASMLQLMGLDLAVPDHSTLSRRAGKRQSSDRRQDDRGCVPARGAHSCPDRQHRVASLRRWAMAGGKAWCQISSGWRKLHLALDADSGDIIAHVMTDQDAGDASQVEPLLDQIEMPIGQFTADGAYDGNPTYQVVARHSADAAVVIPPRSNALERPDSHPPSQRDRHIAAINTDGRMKWQIATGYGKRSLVETAIGRYKSIIGRRLQARSFAAQQTEVAIGCAVLNRMLACARPKSVRCKKAAA